MDKLVYISGVAAQSAMQRMDNVSNNLANVNTPGFRSTLMSFQTAPIEPGEGLATRAYAVETTVGFDDAEGVMQATGRNLDLAIQGRGWFAMQTPDGGEGYSRAGHFSVRNDGLLVNQSGFPVVGEDGPIEIPAGFTFEIGANGAISGFPQGADPTVQNEIARIKMVNPPKEQMTRGLDGLFRFNEGAVADQDEAVRVASGYLEGSNVNSADALVDMISTQREFEMHLKMISMAEDNSKKADGLLSAN